MAEADWPEPLAVPELAQGRVHIWRFDTEGVAQARCAALSAYLSADEAARAEGYRFPRDRRAFALRRGALRALLGAYAVANPADLIFTYGPQGKPALDPSHGGDLTFSVARAGSMALFAVAREMRVGVDLERIRRIPEMEDIISCGTEEERKRWSALPPDERPIAFLRWWTLKEAYLKATGQGLSGALDAFAVEYAGVEPARLLWAKGDAGAPQRWVLDAFSPAQDHIAAIACEGVASVQRFELGEAPLELLLARSAQQGRA